MTMKIRLGNERGFTIVEMLISMLLMIGITATIFSLVDPARGTYRTQPEVSDMQQRLRVGTSFMSNDLLAAGAGAPAGGRLLGSLMNFFAPIQPYRVGYINSDPAQGIFFRDDAITMFSIPPGSPQTTLREAMPQPSSELKTEQCPECPPTEPLSCKFSDNMRVIIFDETGAWDPMTITEVQDSALHLQHRPTAWTSNDLSKRYDVGAQIAQIQQRTYYMNAATNQLMYYDGDQRDEAIVDNVVGLNFEYFGDPRPPVIMRTPGGEVITTYGPRPPALGSTTTAYPAGENCIFMVDPASGLQDSRLPDLAPGSQGLVQMTAGMLSDGPWCPDGGFPTRFDADLLRLRKVGVRVRVQVASAEMRGPAGLLFTNGGSAIQSRQLVPDQEIRFEVTPRNFNLGR
jgi:type II secretory pathway pseudopilin PulG